MKKRFLQVVSLCLVVCLMFSGCGVLNFIGFFQRLFGQPVPFDEMEYARPDVSVLEDALDTCMDLMDEDDDVDDLVNEILTFYSHYTSFYTNYLLANIHYSIDTTDSYWEDEYNYCIEKASAVDAAYDKLMHALADCPLRDELESEDYFGEGYFDSFEGDSLWSDAFTVLMEKEAALQSDYYELSSEAAACDPRSEEYYTHYGSQLAELYVELIALRQEIAAEAGYANYPEFAYDFYHDRDYTATQAFTYMTGIKQELVPIYRDLDTTGLTSAITACSEQETFNYVQDMAQSMEGVVGSAFELLDDCELYHITYGENKYDASFETYLYDYQEPFVFMNPTLTTYDKLTFSHEFGHFCKDFASGGDSTGVDVAEIFSQGMEYLSLCYADDGKDLRTVKMVDSLCVYVEQSAYAYFEQQVYGLTGDDLTTENVEALFGKIGSEFGFGKYDFDSRSYVTIPHLFTSPLYIISYVVSNDAAMQLYQMEQEKKGSGLTCYTYNLTSEETQFLAFLDEAELESPFDTGRLQDVRKTFEEVLG